jgi:hypothetical protein
MRQSLFLRAQVQWIGRKVHLIEYHMGPLHLRVSGLIRENMQGALCVFASICVHTTDCDH